MSGTEVSGGNVVEVVLTWGGDGGGSVLATKYLRPGNRFSLGEGDGCDALVPAEVLGGAAADVVAFEPSGALVSPPNGAALLVLAAHQVRRT